MFTGLENPVHLLMLLLLIVLFFGAKRLPEIGRSLGTGMREFKHSISGEIAAPPIGSPAVVTGSSAQETPSTE